MTSTLSEHLAPEPEPLGPLDCLIAVYDLFHDAEAASDEVTTTQERLHMLEATELAAKTLAGLKRQLTADIFDALGRGVTDVPDYGQVEVRSSPSRKQWEHDRLTEAVIARLGDEVVPLICDEAGEMHPPSQVIANCVRRFTEFARPDWRLGDKARGTTGIQTTLGIDADEYCVTDWNIVVKVLSRGEAA